MSGEYSEYDPLQGQAQARSEAQGGAKERKAARARRAQALSQRRKEAAALRRPLDQGETQARQVMGWEERGREAVPCWDRREPAPSLPDPALMLRLGVSAELAELRLEMAALASGLRDLRAGLRDLRAGLEAMERRARPWPWPIYS